MSLTEWSLLAGLALLWSGSFFFYEIALRALPPMTIMAARLIIGAGALAPFLLRRAWRPPARSLPGLFLLGTIGGVAPYFLIVWGQSGITSGLASILNATVPMFAVGVAFAIHGRASLSAPRLVGVGLGIAGVAVLIGPSLLWQGTGSPLHEAALLASSLCYAIAGYLGGALLPRLSVPAAAAGMMAAGAVVAVPLALAVDGLAPLGVSLDWQTWGALGGIGLLSTAFAYLLYFRVLRTAGAGNLLLVTLLIPIGATWLGWFALDEQLSATAFLGMSIIIFALCVIDGRLFARLRPASR